MTNLCFERLHASIQRRRRRLLVVIRTERLLFDGVHAIRQCLEELPVLCRKAVDKLGNLHLGLRQLLDGADVFVVALNVPVPDLLASACCRRLPADKVDDFQLLFLHPFNLLGQLVECVR